VTAPSSTRRDDLMAAVTLAPATCAAHGSPGGEDGGAARAAQRSSPSLDLTPALAGYGDLAALRKPPDALARHLP
jgi:hypothetical protein